MINENFDELQLIKCGGNNNNCALNAWLHGVLTPLLLSDEKEWSEKNCDNLTGYVDINLNNKAHDFLVCLHNHNKKLGSFEELKDFYVKDCTKDSKKFEKALEKPLREFFISILQKFSSSLEQKKDKEDKEGIERFIRISDNFSNKINTKATELSAFFSDEIEKEKLIKDMPLNLSKNQEAALESEVDVRLQVALRGYSHAYQTTPAFVSIMRESIKNSLMAEFKATQQKPIDKEIEELLDNSLIFFHEQNKSSDTARKSAKKIADSLGRLCDRLSPKSEHLVKLSAYRSSFLMMADLDNHLRNFIRDTISDNIKKGIKELKQKSDCMIRDEWILPFCMALNTNCMMSTVCNKVRFPHTSFDVNPISYNFATLPGNKRPIFYAAHTGGKHWEAMLPKVPAPKASPSKRKKIKKPS